MAGRRRIRVVLYAASAGLLVGAVAAAVWLRQQLLAPVTPPAGGVLVRVAMGEPFPEVLQALTDAGLLPFPLVARLWARSSGVDRTIRPGDYLFTEPRSLIEILDTLRNGTVTTDRVTIPEGYTLRQIADAVSLVGLASADQFLCTARDPEFLESHGLPATGVEGYLFPDTYEFPVRATTEMMLNAMLSRFQQQSASLDGERAGSRFNRHQWVTLASIVEKEAHVAVDRALIAAVFRNRLQLGMRLQADPTAVYERDEPGKVRPEDLEIESPYNTYLNAGLPPGPICNPGLASLHAAAHPAEVDYLYFVARGDGSHVFSKTLDEHNTHVAELRRSRR